MVIILKHHRPVGDGIHILKLQCVATRKGDAAAGASSTAHSTVLGDFVRGALATAALAADDDGNYDANQQQTADDAADDDYDERAIVIVIAAGRGDRCCGVG